jgi:hypothetical protein
MLERIGIEIQIQVTETLESETVAGFERYSCDTIMLPEKILQVIADIPANKSAARCVMEWARTLLEAPIA